MVYDGKVCLLISTIPKCLVSCHSYPCYFFMSIMYCPAKWTTTKEKQG